jgi:neutrophil factor 2
MGIINATLGEHAVAVELFNAATNLDQYLAVAYVSACAGSDVCLASSDDALTSLLCGPLWSVPLLDPCLQHQAGVSNFLLGRYQFAMRDFEEALLYLRGNEAM